MYLSYSIKCLSTIHARHHQIENYQINLVISF